MRLRAAARYWRTLRHLPPRQLGWLAWRRLLRQPRRITPPPPATLRAAYVAPPAVPLAEPCLLGQRRLRFLDHEVDFGVAVDWRAPGQTRLWQYNLHYFEWLRQADVDADAPAGLVDDWIAANPPFAGAGWEPYTLALRLVNWAQALPRRGWNAARLDSFALQAAWLESNLEHHLRANHLFADLKALLFAGAVLDGDLGRRLRTRGQALLRRELPEQFLRDGGHYERTPMYHLLLTRDLVEIARLMAANPDCFDAALRAEVTRRAAAALDFARDVVRPDGSPAAFNDSTGGVAPMLADLEAAAGRADGVAGQGAAVALIDRPDSGFFGARRGGDWLLVDCGPVGPAYQPGHVHCDLLAFELYLDGRALLVNCGVCDYEAGPRRRYARSTAAHNTLSVDDTEQSEVWGVFRVGRRARPLHARLEASETGLRFSGAHDGFHRLRGRVRHTRSLHLDADFRRLEMVDDLQGRGLHAARAWLHFAPGLTLDQVDRAVLVEADGRVLARLEIEGWASIGIWQGERYARFGQVARGATLVLDARAPLPFEARVTIRRAYPEM